MSDGNKINEQSSNKNTGSSKNSVEEEIQKLQKKKLIQENQKLTYEIKQLKIPFWKKDSLRIPILVHILIHTDHPKL